MNYYEILGIPMDADDRAIRTAFRMLARRFHPDAGAGSSPEKFRRLVEAYATLGDPDRRRSYDHELGRQRRPAPTPIEPLFGRQPRAPRRAAVEPLYSAYDPLGAVSLMDQMFEELWRALEESFDIRPGPVRRRAF